VLRNIADREEDVDMIFQVIGSDVLLDALSAGLDAENEDVQSQAVGLLANLSNGFEIHQTYILGHARIMSSLRLCLVDARVEVRRPAVSCVAQLVHGANQKRARELKEFGLESTLRHLCEGPVVSASPLRSPRLGRVMGVETDREIREKAREALHYLEHEVADVAMGGL
jgi:armadillo repeat-containing protein 8